MSDKKSFYITTTLPYVNSDPHIGFAMELVRADVIARFKKSQGFEIFFNTGTDEHGQKVWQNALNAKVEPQKYVDGYAEKFKNLIPLLGISKDAHFIRTTDKNHEAAAEEFWKRCAEAGDIYKKNYTIKYCVGCELEKTDSEIENGHCILHPNLELEIREEENYFFKFSKYQKPLLEFYEKNPQFVIPDFRFNEIKAFVERGLEDFSISRLKKKMSWGVAVPGDEAHVMYVWFDALVSYISTLGWPGDTDSFEKFWKNGTPTQYAGKDNLRQQSAMWQAMLMSANISQTHQIVINGFITSGGQKMSKSLGNVINPIEAVEKYGVEAFRYFVCRELSTFEDSDFTWERYHDAYNGNLSNGLGNLVSRVMQMATTHLNEPVVITSRDESDESVLRHMESFEIKSAMDAIWERIGHDDALIAMKKPFTQIKSEDESVRSEALQIIEKLVRELYFIASDLEPFMPSTSKIIKDAVLNNKKPENLFMRK